MLESLPKPVVDAHKEYLRGGMTRRQFVAEIRKYAVGGLTVAAIWDGLSSNASGQTASDNRTKAALEVTVLDALTGAPIRGAAVKLTIGDPSFGVGPSAEEEERIRRTGMQIKFRWLASIGWIGSLRERNGGATSS